MRVFHWCSCVIHETQRICGIKALSNIKQNREQQWKENCVKRWATEYDFTLRSAALSLSASSIGSPLFQDGITAVRESSQMCKDIRNKTTGRRQGFQIKKLLPGLSSVHNLLDIKYIYIRIQYSMIYVANWMLFIVRNQIYVSSHVFILFYFIMNPHFLTETFI